MSMGRTYFDEVPEETVEVAQAVFKKGNVYMTMRDELGLMYEDSEFVELFAHDGQQGVSPGLLSLVTVMQYAEGLTDRQTAEAVRARIDWKYALNLELKDAGFHYSVLSEFRGRLLEGEKETKLLDDMLSQWQEQGYVKARGAQRTDSTRVVAKIRQLNRLGCVGETMRRVLNELSTVAPEWLRQQIEPDWFDRYGPRFDGYRLPKEKSKQAILKQTIGEDGDHLLSQLYGENAPAFLKEIPAVEVLRRVWVQNYVFEQGQLVWREADNIPASRHLIQSPYDPDARYATKRKQSWNGYVVHMTESCDAELPNLITHVETRPAATSDVEVVDEIHNALAEKSLLPDEHYVDAGYTSAATLLEMQQQHQVEIVGPLLPDSSWQARANQGYASACFSIDWDEQQAHCPDGKTSTAWRETHDKHQQPRIQIQFDAADCRACPQRQLCTKSAIAPRSISVYPQPVYQVLQQARQQQETTEFKTRYKQRAGVEGTISQGARSFDLRYARYVGLAKTRLQHVATAAAMNLTRLTAWLHGVPKGQTRKSSFQRLAPAT